MQTSQSWHPGSSQPGPVRPARKQNSSCDTCKSRRVKCNLSSLPSGASCANCVAKSIPCTQEKNITRKARRSSKDSLSASTAAQSAPVNIVYPLPLVQQQVSASYTHTTQQPSQYLEQYLQPCSIPSYPDASTSFLQTNDSLSSPASASSPFFSFSTFSPESTASSYLDEAMANPYPLPSSPSSFLTHPKIQTPHPPQHIPSLSPSSSQSRLVDSTLSQSLEQTLVDHFFLSAHTHIQSVHPLVFKVEYEAAYCMSSLLPPAAQCLVALMAAHGSRLSDSSHQNLLPDDAKVARERGGREAMSKALAKRGLDLMESYHLTMRPSKHAIDALLLARSLLRMLVMEAEDGAYSEDDRIYFSSSLRLFSAAVHDHIYSLGLWDEAERLNADRADQGMHPVEIPTQRMLWIAFTSDSFELFIDPPRPPRVTIERLFSAFPYVPRGGDVPLPGPAGLSPEHCFLLLMASYPMLGVIVRAGVESITNPAANRSRHQPCDVLYSACESLWAKHDAYADWVDQVASRVLQSRSSNLSTSSGSLSPLLFFIHLKMAGSNIWIKIHTIIRDRLSAERQQLNNQSPLHPSPNTPFIFNPYENASSSPFQPSIALLHVLELQGLERALTECRMLAHRFAKIAKYRPDLLGIEFAPAFQFYHAAQFLARVPTVEQGLRGKMPSFDYSWEWKNKCMEIDWLLHAMEVLSGPNAVSKLICKVDQMMCGFIPAGCARFHHVPFKYARESYDHQSSQPTSSRPTWFETKASNFLRLFTPSDSVISPDLHWQPFKRSCSSSELSSDLQAFDQPSLSSVMATPRDPTYHDARSLDDTTFIRPAAPLSLLSEASLRPTQQCQVQTTLNSWCSTLGQDDGLNEAHLLVQEGSQQQIAWNTFPLSAENEESGERRYSSFGERMVFDSNGSALQIFHVTITNLRTFDAATPLCLPHEPSSPPPSCIVLHLPNRTMGAYFITASIFQPHLLSQHHQHALRSLLLIATDK